MRASQIGGETIMAIAIIVAIFFGVMVAVTILKFKIEFAMAEVSSQEDQIPAMQALSYSTVGRLMRMPISFYDVASISAATGEQTFTLPDSPSGVESSLTDLMNERLATYSSDQLILFLPNCFEYTLDTLDRHPLLTEMLAPNSQVLPTCAEYTKAAANAGEESYREKNYIYYIPLPPIFDDAARLTEQFIRVYGVRAQEPTVGRPPCKAAGADAASPDECCSGSLDGNVCAP